MLFRSTNGKFTHYGGDILSNTDDSSHGVHLTGGSTGGIVQPCGDEDNIALTVRAKGAGPLNLVSSGTFTLTSTQVDIVSTEIGVGSSGAQVTIAGGAPFSGFVKFTDTAVATPDFNTTNAMVMETTHAITGVAANTLGGTTGWFVIANPHNLSTDCALLHAYVSDTATEIHCRFAKVSTVAVSASTATISFLVIRA